MRADNELILQTAIDALALLPDEQPFEDDLDSASEIQTPATLSGGFLSVMGPPTRRASATMEPDLSEEVVQKHFAHDMDDFTTAFALFARTLPLSRDAYASLLEVLLSLIHI